MRARFLVAAAVLALEAAACSSGAPPFFVRVSGTMPVIAGTTLDGRGFGPSDYRGKIVVVNFWNQDCPPCRQEQQVLQADSGRLSSRGVIVVGLLYVGGNWPNDPAAALDFLRSNGVTYPDLVDAGSELARAFGIGGIPSTVVADRDGHLRFRILGRVRPGYLGQLVARLG